MKSRFRACFIAWSCVAALALSANAGDESDTGGLEFRNILSYVKGAKTEVAYAFSMTQKRGAKEKTFSAEGSYHVEITDTRDSAPVGYRLTLLPYKVNTSRPGAPDEEREVGEKLVLTYEKTNDGWVGKDADGDAQEYYRHMFSMLISQDPALAGALFPDKPLRVGATWTPDFKAGRDYFLSLSDADDRAGIDLREDTFKAECKLTKVENHVAHVTLTGAVEYREKDRDTRMTVAAELALQIDVKAGRITRVSGAITIDAFKGDVKNSTATLTGEAVFKSAQ